MKIGHKLILIMSLYFLVFLPSGFGKDSESDPTGRPSSLPHLSTSLEHITFEIRAGHISSHPRLKNKHVDEIWWIDNSGAHRQEYKIGDVYTIPAGTPLYHWGPEPLKDWAKAGYPDDEDMKERRSKSGHYLSADIMDSSQYGPVCVVGRAAGSAQ